MPVLECKCLRNIFIVILGIYFCLNMINYKQKIDLELQTNLTDKSIIVSIENSIETYESKTGIVIKNIAFSTDENSRLEQRRISTPAMGDSGLLYSWSKIGSINYWTNRNIKEVKMNEEIYNQYFKGKDWNEFNEEQCIFLNETLYYCIY